MQVRIALTGARLIALSMLLTGGYNSVAEVSSGPLGAWEISGDTVPGTQKVLYANSSSVCAGGGWIIGGLLRGEQGSKQNLASGSYLQFLPPKGTVLRPVATIQGQQIGAVHCMPEKTDRTFNNTAFYVASTTPDGHMYVTRFYTTVLPGDYTGSKSRKDSEWSKDTSTWTTNTPATTQVQTPAATPDKGLSVVAKDPPVDVEAVRVTTDGKGDVYVLGRIKGGPTTLANLGDWDILVQKLSPKGDVLWTQRYGTPALDRAYDLKVDANDQLWIVGETKGKLSNEENQGNSDAFVLAVTASQGAPVRTRLFGTPANDVATSVALNDAGQVFVGGYTYGTWGTSIMRDDSDAFVVRFASRTSLQVNAISFLGQMGKADAIRDLAWSGNSLLAGGDTDGLLPGATSKGGKDLVLYTLDTQLGVQRREQFGSSGDDALTSLSVDPNGDSRAVFVTGVSSGTLSGAYLARLNESPGQVIHSTPGSVSLNSGAK